MKTLITVFLIFGSIITFAQGGNEDPTFARSNDLQIKKAEVNYDSDLEQLIFSIEVKGDAGASKPKTFGSLNGAPVLGYVFPTSLKATDVGFSAVEGIVALALTSHPDFDDTPLWDENNDRDFLNDGLIWHAHWVVLNGDDRVPGGLSVIQFDANDSNIKLPPTNPGMPIYMDSPGFNIITRGNKITVVVPAFRMNRQTTFNFDAVTAYMEVNTENKQKPLLGVYAVYSVASGDLSLPYSVGTR
ncbi:MAG: hypothetical protein R8G66_22600 [Cytophagales bacterium]|nr:hypothetical protein [Cytophagales bacterium]